MADSSDAVRKIDREVAETRSKPIESYVAASRMAGVVTQIHHHIQKSLCRASECWHPGLCILAAVCLQLSGEAMTLRWN